VAESTALIRERLVGLRVAGIDKTSRSTRVGDFTIERELQIIEVYLSAAPDDPQEAAAVAPPWNSLPWHVLVLMEEAVKRSWAAFSQTEAQRRDLPWLDLVRLDSLSRRLAPLVAEFERDAYRPATLKDLVSVDQARMRWSALKKFHQERGHFLVTNGPYVLKGWSKRATTFEVFRNLSYPLGVGSYDAYPIPRRAYIVKIERKSNGLIIFAEIEKVEKFQRTYEIVRAPLTGARSGPTRVDVAVCRYLVVSSEGQVVHSGQGRLEDNGTFAVALEGKLGPGDYTVITALSLNGNTMNPDIKRILYTVTGDS
jgi:hypothetical protein